MDFHSGIALFLQMKLVNILVDSGLSYNVMKTAIVPRAANILSYSPLSRL